MYVCMNIFMYVWMYGCMYDSGSGGALYASGEGAEIEAGMYVCMNIFMYVCIYVCMTRAQVVLCMPREKVQRSKQVCMYV